MVRFCLALVFCTTVGVTRPAEADCKCLYAGGIAKQGETACIKTASGPRLARCEMVLNNSSWTVLDRPCDIEQSDALPHSRRRDVFSHQS